MKNIVFVVMGIVDNTEVVLGAQVDIMEAKKHLLKVKGYEGYDMVELYAWQGKAQKFIERY